MKLKEITEGVYIPEAETREEEFTLAAQNLMKQLYIDTSGFIKEYDPITHQTNTISLLNP